jgi:hypothetical protein
MPQYEHHKRAKMHEDQHTTECQHPYKGVVQHCCSVLACMLVLLPLHCCWCQMTAKKRDDTSMQNGWSWP